MDITSGYFLKQKHKFLFYLNSLKICRYLISGFIKMCPKEDDKKTAKLEYWPVLYIFLFRNL